MCLIKFQSLWECTIIGDGDIKRHIEFQLLNILDHSGPYVTSLRMWVASFLRRETLRNDPVPNSLHCPCFMSRGLWEVFLQRGSPRQPFLVLCLTPRFDVVGYGCMTCIGNSGPLPEPVVEAITQVMSGARVLRPLVWVSITLGRFWKL